MMDTNQLITQALKDILAEKQDHVPGSIAHQRMERAEAALRQVEQPQSGSVVTDEQIKEEIVRVIETEGVDIRDDREGAIVILVALLVARALLAAQPAVEQEAKPMAAGEWPKGWRFVEKKTCYQIHDGHSCIANLVGPDAEKNAKIISHILAAPQEQSPSISESMRTLIVEGQELDEDAAAPAGVNTREAFEDWYAPIFRGGEPANMLRHSVTGEYSSAQDQIAWMAFQECARLAGAGKQEPVSINVHQVTLKTRGEMKRTIPADRLGWWHDVCPGQHMTLRDATASDIVRCFLKPGAAQEPENYLCELPANGSLIHRDAIKHCRTFSISAIQTAAPSSEADAKNAARYRWLRDESWAGYNASKSKPQVFETVTMVLDGARNFKTILAEEALDAAIDAALAAQKGEV